MSVAQGQCCKPPANEGIFGKQIPLAHFISSSFHTTTTSTMPNAKKKRQAKNEDFKACSQCNAALTLLTFHGFTYIQKKKLKVGKKKALPDNYTDTTFRSKSKSVDRPLVVLLLTMDLERHCTSQPKHYRGQVPIRYDEPQPDTQRRLVSVEAL